MNNNNKLIPELRFPEFDEPWVAARLGDVVSFKVTNSFSRDNLNYENGNVKNIHYGDIHTKFKTLFDIEKENVPFINLDIDNQKIKEDSYCQEGDLVLADASEDLADVGKSIEIVNLNNEKLVSGLHTILARPNKGLFPSGFVGYLFKSEFIRQQIQKESQGTKVLSISATRLQNLIIHYPLSIIHSKKIASCLSSLDELISSESQKLEALQAHKKGLMQNLFPQEGETVPKMRFPEFENDGEWVEKKLGEVAIKIQDGTHFSPKSFDNGDFLYITSKNVKNGYIELSTAQFISREEHENIYKRCDVTQGDVLLTKDGTIGQSCINELSMPFSLLSSVAFIRVKPNFSNYFLYHLLVSQIGQKEIESQIAGQALSKET